MAQYDVGSLHVSIHDRPLVPDRGLTGGHCRDKEFYDVPAGKIKGGILDVKIKNVYVPHNPE
jgi:hypothetical protein